MPSYYCHKLESTLHFLPKEIKFCCSCVEGPGIVIEDFNKINKKSIEKEKEKNIKALKNGEIPKQCQGCNEYKEINEPPKKFFETLFENKKKYPVSYIIIDHYKQCDCNCIYCSQKIIYKGEVKNYSLLPLIKQLYANNMIDNNNLKVEFQGGNISCLNEFDLLLEEFKKHNCTNFAILTNGIKYMPQLENLSNNPESFVCISLDCGTKETFRKIKNVDAFEQTIENIRKLKKNTTARIVFKYILIKDVNDNLDEIKAFLQYAKELVTGYIVIDIDYRNTMLNHSYEFKVPKHYYELVDYIEKYCNENNIIVGMTDYTKQIMKEGTNIHKS